MSKFIKPVYVSTVVGTGDIEYLKHPVYGRLTGRDITEFLPIGYRMIYPMIYTTSGNDDAVRLLSTADSMDATLVDVQSHSHIPCDPIDGMTHARLWLSGRPEIIETIDMKFGLLESGAPSAVSRSSLAEYLSVLWQRTPADSFEMRSIENRALIYNKAKKVFYEVPPPVRFSRIGLRL